MRKYYLTVLNKKKDFIVQGYMGGEIRNNRDFLLKSCNLRNLRNL